MSDLDHLPLTEDEMSDGEKAIYLEVIRSAYPAPKTDIRAAVTEKIRLEKNNGKILSGIPSASAKKSKFTKAFVKWGSLAACAAIVCLAGIRILPVLTAKAENMAADAADFEYFSYTEDGSVSEDSVLSDAYADTNAAEGTSESSVEIMLRADANFSNMNDTSSVWDCLGVAKEYSENGESYSYMVASTAVKGFGFFQTVGRAFAYSIHIAGSIFKVLGVLFTGALGLSSFGGPITTIKMTSQIATMGWVQFFEITSLIGVNLAVFNLLPIPALDGSKVIFTIIEWIRKKPLNRKVEAIIHAAGFVFLIGFAILVDILQFI